MGGGARVVASKGNEIYKSLHNNIDDSWIRDKGLRRLNIGIATMFASAAANGYDGSLINGLLAMPYFLANLGQVNPNLLGVTLAGISLGGLPAFIPASYVSDYVGRRFCVGIGSSIMLAAAIIQCATSGIYAFLGTRIMIGIGRGFAQTAAPPLTTELAHPRHRGNVTNLFQAIWYWGAIVSAILTLGMLSVNSSWSWRVPCLLQGLFPGIQLIGLLIVPESPRWLISKGRHEQALQILARYHANGKEDDDLVQFEYHEICQAISMEKEAAKSTGWATFFATKGNRHRFLICILVGFMINWAGNGTYSPWYDINSGQVLIAYNAIRYRVILSCADPEERWYNFPRDTGWHQPRSPDLERNTCIWRSSGSRTLRSAPTVVDISLRNAGVFHRCDGAQCHLRGEGH